LPFSNQGISSSNHLSGIPRSIPRSGVRRPSSAAAWANFGAIYTLTNGNHHDPILGGRSVLTSLGYGPDGRRAEAYQKVENGGSCLRRVRSIASVMDTR
jgi:hypothetical protein